MNLLNSSPYCILEIYTYIDDQDYLILRQTHNIFIQIPKWLTKTYTSYGLPTSLSFNKLICTNINILPHTTNVKHIIVSKCNGNLPPCWPQSLIHLEFDDEFDYP